MTRKELQQVQSEIGTRLRETRLARGLTREIDEDALKSDFGC